MNPMRGLKLMLLASVLIINCDADKLPTWQKIDDAKMDFVSVGEAGVLGLQKEVGGPSTFVDYRPRTYRLPWKDGCKWTRIDGSLLRIDVGKNVMWGVNRYNQLFIRHGISEDQPGGTEWEFTDYNMKDVTVSPAGHVWALTQWLELRYKNGSSNSNPLGDNWENVESESGVTQMSMGETGLWMVNENNTLYYRNGTYGDLDTSGTGWTLVDEGFKHVSSSEDVVFALTTNGRAMARTGITASTPTGTGWLDLGKTFKQLDSLGGVIWGIDEDNNVWRGIYTFAPDKTCRQLRRGK